jgi:hypothetical protein
MHLLPIRVAYRQVGGLRQDCLSPPSFTGSSWNGSEDKDYAQYCILSGGLV